MKKEELQKRLLDLGELKTTPIKGVAQTEYYTGELPRNNSTFGGVSARDAVDALAFAIRGINDSELNDDFFYFFKGGTENILSTNEFRVNSFSSPPPEMINITANDSAFQQTIPGPREATFNISFFDLDGSDLEPFWNNRITIIFPLNGNKITANVFIESSTSSTGFRNGSIGIDKEEVTIAFRVSGQISIEQI